MASSKKVKLAIIGTGGMANGHAMRFNAIKGCDLVAAFDIDEKKAKKFAAFHKIPKVYTNLDELLADDEIDGVSNVTPDAFHAPISIAAIAKGKHVLCEKPLATNYADAKKMADAAKRKKVINMVNFSYRDTPAIQKAKELVAKGAIGKIVHFDAYYLQSWLTSKIWGDWKTTDAWLWRLSSKHGSMGVLGDVGVHILDFATYPAGDVKKLNCQLKTFSEIKGKKRGKYPLDANDTAVIRAELTNGALGSIHTTRWATGHVNSLKLSLYGTKGAIQVELDWAIDKLRICQGKDVDKCAWKVVKCPKVLSNYERFVKSIQSGKNHMADFARGAYVQKLLDSCFTSDFKGKDVLIR